VGGTGGKASRMAEPVQTLDSSSKDPAEDRPPAVHGAPSLPLAAIPSDIRTEARADLDAHDLAGNPRDRPATHEPQTRSAPPPGLRRARLHRVTVERRLL